MPIVHFTKATPPFIICIKWVMNKPHPYDILLLFFIIVIQELTDGEFENNLLSLNLIEGIDYYNFS